MGILILMALGATFTDILELCARVLPFKAAMVVRWPATLIPDPFPPRTYGLSAAWIAAGRVE